MSSTHELQTGWQIATDEGSVLGITVATINETPNDAFGLFVFPSFRISHSGRILVGGMSRAHRP